MLLAAPAVFAQTSHSTHAMPPLQREMLERPLPLREGIGVAHDAVSAKDPQAQAYYDQGLAYLHSYMWIEAARSFHQAMRLDSSLVMAGVGLSYAYAELNAPSEAHTALEQAQQRGQRGSKHDRR